MITWTVAFDENSFTTGGVNILDSTNFNPTQKGAKLRELLTNAVRSAGEEWGKYLQGSTNIVVQVVNDPDLGTSSTSNYQTSNTVSTSRLNKNYPLPQLRESILAHKIITGNDANGAAPDVVINIGSSYLKNNFWFDPATFPSYAENLPDSQKKVDPSSAFAHEIGHALAFNGFWSFDPLTGLVPKPTNSLAVESPFDDHVSLGLGSLGIGGSATFDGPNARYVYGDRVPLFHSLGSSQNIYHLGGDSAPILKRDLLNGSGFLEVAGQIRTAR